MLVPAPSLAADPLNDPWREFRYFLGVWEGEESGPSGEGVGKRSYRLVLDDHFIEQRHTSIVAPQPKNPEGAAYQDSSMFSFDRTAGVYRLRVHYSRGFSIEYELIEHDAQAKSFCWESRRIENGRRGTKLRYRVNVVDDDTFLETYERERDQEPFREFVRNRWTRTR